MKNIFRMPRVVKELAPNIRKTIVTFWYIDKKRLVGYVLAMSLQVVSSLAALYFAGRVLTALTNVIADKGTADAVWWALSFAIFFQILEQVCWRIMTYLQNASKLYWKTKTIPEFHRKRLELDIQRFEDSEYSTLLNKVMEDYNWKTAEYAYQILNFSHAVLRALGSVIIVVSFAPWLIPLLFIFSIPSLYIETLMSKFKWDIWAIKSDSSRAYYKTTWMFDHKNNLIEFRLFGVGNYLIDFCRKMLSDFFGSQRKVLDRYIKPAIGARIVEGVFVGAVEFWLIAQVIAGKFAIGQYSFYSGVLQQFNNALGLIFSTYGILYEWNLFMTDYYKIMETPSLIGKPKNPIKIPSGKIPSIDIHNLSFAYPSAPEKLVYDGLDFSIKPGEHVAIVGENGAGKTTLIKLLLRLYDVNKGSIKINGHDLKQLDLDSWYAHVGVLFQDFSHYPFTASENIRLGKIQRPTDKTKIAESARRAGASDMIDDFPKQYQTILDNSFTDGVEPSGGQWQRIALARAFYRDSSIIILDEPTSAIDAKAEYEIFNNIFDHYKDKTAIIVSHRFSTVRRASLIVVIAHGKIVEQGSHRDLMKQRGLYHEMFTKQAEGYR